MDTLLTELRRPHDCVLLPFPRRQRRGIRQIILYIKQHNPAAAIGMHERFIQAIRQLAEAP